MFPQNLSERQGAPAVSDLVRILLSLNNLVRLWLMAPNNGVTISFYQIFKELSLKFLKLSHKTEREGTLPNLFCKASITLIPKLNKDTHTHTHTHISYTLLVLINIYRCKNPQ
jgi:hypothetical protein